MKYIINAVAMVLVALLNGTALSFLWEWFVTSAFGLPVLTIAQATGLVLAVSLITNQYIPKNLEDPDEAENFVKHSLFTPVFFTALGWVIRFLL